MSSARLGGSLVVLMDQHSTGFTLTGPFVLTSRIIVTKFNAEVHAKHTTLNGSGSASVEDQQQLQKHVKDLEASI